MDIGVPDSEHVMAPVTLVLDLCPLGLPAPCNIAGQSDESQKGIGGWAPGHQDAKLSASLTAWPSGAARQAGAVTARIAPSLFYPSAQAL